MKFNLFCPIELDSLVISAETQTAEAAFFNLSQQTITAIKYTMVLFNESGEKIAETPAELEGIELKPREVFTSVVAAENAAYAEVVFSEITFDDETVFAVSNEEVEITYNELLESDKARFERAGAPDACCFAKEEDSYWLCVCGRPNLPSSENCIRCQRDKDAVLTDFITEESVAMAIVKKEEADALEAERLAAIKAEEEAARKALRNKKLKKAGIIAAIAILAVVVLYFAFKLIVTSIGDSSAKEGDYAKAYSMYKLVGDYDKIEDISDRLYGNTVSNLTTLGMLAQDDNNIYHLGLDNTIFKQDKKTGEKTKFEGIRGALLNASGGWLYYIDAQEGSQRICRISPDGVTNEVVYDKSVYFLQTMANDIYFITDRIVPLDENDQAAEEKTTTPLYVLKEGETEPQLITDAKVNVFTIYKNRIYYTDFSDKALYSMNLSGKDTKKILDGPIYRFDISNDKIYYLSDIAGGEQNPFMPAYNLYTSDINGKNQENLFPDITVSWFALDNDTIYFIDSNNGDILYKSSNGEAPVTEAENVQNSFVNVNNGTVLYLAAEISVDEESQQQVIQDIKIYLSNSDKTGYEPVSSLNDINAEQTPQTEAPPDEMPMP